MVVNPKESNSFTATHQDFLPPCIPWNFISSDTSLPSPMKRVFSQAARICSVSQSSLSRQVAKLELEIGSTLFDRLPKETLLTASGERFYARACEILSAIENAKRHAYTDRHEGKGLISIGVIPTIAPYFLPKFLHRFAIKFPRVDVVVTEDVTAALEQKCVDGELDFVVMATPVMFDSLKHECIVREELLLAFHSEHRLAKYQHITKKDLDFEAFILLQEDHCLGDQIVSFCQRSSDHRPVVTCTSSQLTTVTELIELGLGISFIPKMAISQINSEKLIFRSLEEEVPYRDIVIVSNSNRTQDWVQTEAEGLIKETIKHLA